MTECIGELLDGKILFSSHCYVSECVFAETKLVKISKNQIKHIIKFDVKEKRERECEKNRKKKEIKQDKNKNQIKIYERNRLWKSLRKKKRKVCNAR